ncbi:MAG: D-aminoacylase [Candidatus Heimdallarchaeota archaeon]|nr:D-aminoacylase [Candidatus Heimdallarchaeota archaeon]
MEFDIVIKNGRVIDGTGNPWFKADIGITKGKITKIGLIEPSEKTKVIDATGLIVSPGFIDIHSHSDYSIPFDPMVISTIHQGITTLVVGMCGASLAPVNPEKQELFDKEFSMAAPPGLEFNVTWTSYSEYLDEMEKIGCSSNVAYNLGFGMIRMAAMGYEDRKPTKDEMQKMKDYIRDAMEAGAFGISTGLIYTPQAYAETDEVLELTKEVAKYNGLYFSHIRNEGNLVIEAIQEVIDIVEQSGCRGGQIAHHKVSGKANWGRSKETLKLIEETNQRGINITCDQYPYNRGATSLMTLLPPWSHEGGPEKLVERLKDPKEKEKIKKDLYDGTNFESFVKNIGWECVYISSLETEKWSKYMGKSLTEITKAEGKEDEFEVLCEILIDEEAKGGMTVESMGEEDIQRIMKGRYTMIGCDGSSIPLTGPLSYGKPHPRFFGTFPRVLGHFVREKKIMSLETAIRKITSFPAQTLGLADRGLLKKNMWADIVVFDQEKITDKATFANPHQLSVGIDYVLVNGDIVIEKGEHQSNLPGKTLRST